MPSSVRTAAMFSISAPPPVCVCVCVSSCVPKPMPSFTHAQGSTILQHYPPQMTMCFMFTGPTEATPAGSAIFIWTASRGGDHNRSRCDPTPKYLSKLGGGELGGGVQPGVGGGVFLPGVGGGGVSAGGRRGSGRGSWGRRIQGPGPAAPPMDGVLPKNRGSCPRCRPAQRQNKHARPCALPHPHRLPTHASLAADTPLPGRGRG